jgi:hypothetical protein
VKLAAAVGILFLGAGCHSHAPEDLLKFPDGGFIPLRLGDGGVAPWKSAICLPQPEQAGGPAASDLSVRGECSFRQRASVICRAQGDDFYVVTRRNLAGGRVATVYFNIESFHGPGDYDESQTHVWIGDGQALYRWSNAHGKASLVASGPYPSDGRESAQFPTAGVTSVVLSEMVLAAEPGTGASGEIRVSGTLSCLVRGGAGNFRPLAP